MDKEDKFQGELDEMSKALEEPDAGVEELRTNAPGTGSPTTELPSTKAPNTEVPGTNAPSTEAPVTEAPADEDEEVKKLKDENENLRLKLAEKEGPKTKTPATKAPSTEIPISDEDFLGDIDLDELTRNPEAFNQILNKMYKKSRETARDDIRKGDETIIRSVPDIVKNNIALVSKLKDVSDKFYVENKDLVPFKKVVGAVFEELISENPNKTYEELLPEASKVTREKLELHKLAKADKKDDDPPILPRKKGGQRQQPKPNTNPLLDELDAMDKALGLD